MSFESYIHPELKRDIRAYLTVLSDACRECLSRRCHSCDLRRTRELLSRLNANVVFCEEKDVSYAARQSRILGILAKAGRPLRSEEIDISDICYRAKKSWTLKDLVRRGKIARSLDADGKRVYSLPTTKTEKENQDEDKLPGNGEREEGEVPASGADRERPDGRGRA